MSLPTKVAPIGSPDRSLEAAGKVQDATDLRRHEEMLAMVRGEDLKIPWWWLWWPILATVASVGAVSIGLVAYKFHDVMVEPEYWWECLLVQCNIWMAMCALMYAASTPAIINMDNIYTWYKAWFITYVAGYVFGYIAFWCATTMLWVYGFNLRYPIPMGGIVNQFCGLIFMIISLWFQMPKAWRQDAAFNKRAKWTMIFHIYGVVISAFYWVLWIAMAYVPADYQPIMAVVIPVCREGLVAILKYIGKRSAGKVVTSVELQCGHFISQFHVLFLSIAVGGLATQPTTYLLLGIDFGINMHSCYTVYTKHKEGELEEAAEELMTLTLNEYLEAIVPVCYLICFLVAFYGPNADTVGNVKSSYWHYVGLAEEDLSGFIQTLILLVIVDALSLAFAWILLKWKSNISMFQMYLFQWREFGLCLAAQQMYILETMFCASIIGCAIDFTFQFNWLRDGFVLDPADDERFSTSVNMTYLDASLTSDVNITYLG